MALGQSPFTKIEASSGTSTSAALSHTPTAGNTIVAGATAFWASGGSPVNLLAVSGATFGAFTKVGAAVTGGTGAAGSDDTLGLFYAASVSAVADTITITGGSGTSGVVGILTELTGYTSQTVDVPGTPTSTGIGTSVTSAAVTNSQANAVYVCAVGTNGGSSTLTPTSSFTSSGSETNGASFPVIDLIYLVVASAASRTATETVTSASWATCIAAFSDSGGGGGFTAKARRSFGAFGRVGSRQPMRTS